MLCEPAASELVEYVATPEALSAPLPSVVPPSRNVTEPLGPGALVPVTVAVKVRLVPVGTLLAEEVRAVVVCTMVTVTDTATDIEDALFVSPA
jgi:hypothetical protein